MDKRKSPSIARVRQRRSQWVVFKRLFVLGKTYFVPAKRNFAIKAGDKTPNAWVLGTWLFFFICLCLCHYFHKSEVHNFPMTRPTIQERLPRSRESRTYWSVYSTSNWRQADNINTIDIECYTFWVFCVSLRRCVSIGVTHTFDRKAARQLSPAIPPLFGFGSCHSRTKLERSTHDLKSWFVATLAQMLKALKVHHMFGGFFFHSRHREAGGIATFIGETTFLETVPMHGH